MLTNKIIKKSYWSLFLWGEYDAGYTAGLGWEKQG